MVPLLDRMLCAEIQASVPVSIACFTVLLAINYLFALARVFVDFGLPVHDALLLTLYKVPYFAAFSVPMGVFLATVLGIGRLADRNEIAALKGRWRERPPHRDADRAGRRPGRAGHAGLF